MSRLFAGHASVWILSIIEIFVAADSRANSFNFGNSINRSFNGSSLSNEAPIDLTHLDPSQHNDSRFSALSNSTDSVRQLLDERGLNPYIAINRVRQFNYENRSIASDYQFEVGAYAICGTRLRVIEHADGSRAVVGTIPLVDHVSNFLEENWPDQSDSARFGIDEFAKHQNLNSTGARIVSSERCLLNEQGRLEPVWDFVAEIDGLQFDIWSTPWAVAKANPRYFDTTATVRAYDPNPTQGNLIDFKIQVQGDGTLTNDYFTTIDSKTFKRAQSASQVFIYDPVSDRRFAEASTFVHANQQYDFLKSMGYMWHGAKPITIFTYSLVNNAFYTPSEKGSGPSISIGDSDGVQLKNLAFDADVISHEFGHHVVYDSITNRDAEEARILHEGLADFLAMSRTGDPCLGESICPVGSKICEVHSKCLRTADNSLTFNDAKYNSYGGDYHRKSQLVSAFLWDVRRVGGMPGDTLTRYVMEAISYLPSDATIKSLIAAVLYVDQKHSSTYQTIIVNAAVARNLSPADLGIELTNLGPSINRTQEASAPEGDSGRKKGGFLGCGTVGSNNGIDQNSASWIVILLFLLPLLSLGLDSRRKSS